MRFFSFSLIVIAFVATVGCSTDTPKPPENQQESAIEPTAVNQVQKPAKPTYTPAVLKVKARELYADYENNEIAADLKYKDKVYTITGYIRSIGKDVTNRPYILLQTNNSLFGVQCFFENSEIHSLARLSKKQYVYVKGKITGHSIGYILVEKCSLQ